MTHRTLGAVPLIACLFPLSAALGATEELTYAGSSTIAMSILYEGALRGFEARTGTRFAKVDTLAGSGKGLELVARGEVSVCGFAQPFKEEDRARGLVPHLIGHDALGIWVNQANPVRALTSDQARSIFTGRASGWEEFGGRRAKIHLYMTDPEDRKATQALIQDILLKRQPVSRTNATLVEVSRDSLLGVAQDEDGICAASIGLGGTFSTEFRAKLRLLSLDGVVPDKKAIQKGNYPLSRPLFLVTKGKPEGKIKDFIDFMLSPEGQALVARNFVPARPAPPPKPAGLPAAQP